MFSYFKFLGGTGENNNSSSSPTRSPQVRILVVGFNEKQCEDFKSLLQTLIPTISKSKSSPDSNKPTQAPPSPQHRPANSKGSSTTTGYNHSIKDNFVFQYFNFTNFDKSQDFQRLQKLAGDFSKNPITAILYIHPIQIEFGERERFISRMLLSFRPRLLIYLSSEFYFFTRDSVRKELSQKRNQFISQNVFPLIGSASSSQQTPSTVSSANSNMSSSNSTGISTLFTPISSVSTVYFWIDQASTSFPISTSASNNNNNNGSSTTPSAPASVKVFALDCSLERIAAKCLKTKTNHYFESFGMDELFAIFMLFLSLEEIVPFIRMLKLRSDESKRRSMENERNRSPSAIVFDKALLSETQATLRTLDEEDLGLNVLFNAIEAIEKQSFVMSSGNESLGYAMYRLASTLRHDPDRRRQARLYFDLSFASYPKLKNFAKPSYRRAKLMLDMQESTQVLLKEFERIETSCKPYGFFDEFPSAMLVRAQLFLKVDRLCEARASLIRARKALGSPDSNLFSAHDKPDQMEDRRALEDLERRVDIELGARTDACEKVEKDFVSPSLEIEAHCNGILLEKAYLKKEASILLSACEENLSRFGVTTPQVPIEIVRRASSLVRSKFQVCQSLKILENDLFPPIPDSESPSDLKPLFSSSDQKRKSWHMFTGIFQTKFQVAIKEFDMSSANTMVDIERERRICMQICLTILLQHTNLTKCRGWFTTKKGGHKIFLMNELAPFGSLAALLSDPEKSKMFFIRGQPRSTTQVERIRSVALQVCRAIVFLHAMGVSWGNCSADNIVIFAIENERTNEQEQMAMEFSVKITNLRATTGSGSSVMATARGSDLSDFVFLMLTLWAGDVTKQTNEEEGNMIKPVDDWKVIANRISEQEGPDCQIPVRLHELLGLLEAKQIDAVSLLVRLQDPRIFLH